jgi:hypothetical protein
LKKKEKMAGRVVQVVDHLTSKTETLNASLSTAKNKKKNKNEPIPSNKSYIYVCITYTNIHTFIHRCINFYLDGYIHRFLISSVPLETQMH